MENQNKIVESILAKEKAKGAPKPEAIKPTQGMSIAEKIVAKEQEAQQQLADLTARIGANAEAMQSAISYRDAQKAKARVADLGEGLTLDQYPTWEEQQAERAQALAESEMAEAKAKAHKEFYEAKVGDRGKELVGEASKRLGGIPKPTLSKETEKKIAARKEAGAITVLGKADGLLPDGLAEELRGFGRQTMANILAEGKIAYDELPKLAREEARKIAEAYVVKHPEDAYDVENLTNYFANEIYGPAHQTRVNNDDKYMREAFKATTGMEYETYMRNYANKLKREIKALRDQSYATAERDAKSRADYDLGQGVAMLRFPALEGKAAGEVASKPYDDMLEQIEAWEENDFSSGFASGFDTSNFLSFGLVDVLNNYKTNEALEKAYRGEKLSSEEERLVRLVQIQQEFEDIRKEIYEPQGWMSSVGEGVGTTVNMLPEFAVSMGLTGGLGSFSKMGTMAQLKNALKVGGDDLLNYGVNTLRKGAYNYGLAKGRGLIAAPLMPTTYNTYFDTLNSGYKFNEDGNLVYTPVDKTQAYFGSVFSTANEISSEYLGIGIGSAIGWGGTKLGKMIANTRVGRAATRTTNKVRKYIPKLSPEAKVAMRTLGVQTDPVSETLSEALGDIMTSYEQSMIGMDVDTSQYGTFDYWMTLAGVSLVYGGSIATLGAVKSYRDVKNASTERDAILGKISNRNLHDTLLAISTTDDVVMASSALADFDWKGNDISPEDKRYARDFRVADLNVKIMQGAVEEGTRLAQFEGALENMRDIVYQESAGEPSDKIYEAEMDGKPVYVINGLEEGNTTGLVVVVDPATGNKSSVDKSKITPTRQYTVDEYIDEMYSKAFSLEEETKRVEDVKAKALQMENPTEKDVQRVASTLDITLPKVGDAVMLANGNMGSVTERLSPTEFAVQDMTGVTYKVHFTDILSTDKLTATAQGALARGEVPTTITTVPQEEATAETTTDENGITMGSEVTVDGRVGTVRARTENGDYVVAFEDESGNYENAEVEVYTPTEMASLMGVAPMPTATTESAAEGTPTTTEVATTEDGSVDIEQMSAEDAAKVLVERAGTIEEAIAQVKQVIDTVTEERKKMAKAEKKASLNDIGKKSAELQALDARLEFYGEVLGVLEAMLAEQQKQTMAEAQNIAEEAGVATTEETTNEDDNKPADEVTSGLIRNGAEMKFTDNVIRMVDFIAQRLGITVEFVDGLKNDAGQPINGDIKGKHVRISTKGDRGVKFIVGHEFFHRIKDNIDEATYNKYIGALKEFFGEERWEEALNAQKSKYRAHNVAVAKKSMERMTPEEVATIAEQLGVNIEGLSAEDAKAAVARAAMRKAEQGDKVARTLFPTMLTYSDALMLEETAADISGEMVDNLDAFSNFVEDNKSEYAIIRGMHKALRYIHDMFASFGQTTRQRKVKRLIKNLESIMAEAVKNERKGAKKARKDGESRSSLIGEIGAEALDRAEEVATRLDNLAVAREMESAGKDAKAIRMTTGWERGADGLWRYEIMDAEVNLYDGDENTIRKKIEVAEEEEKDFMQQSKADTKELREHTNTYLAEMREKYGVTEGEETDAMTEEEIAHLQSLTNKEIEFEDYKERRRNELYNRRMALEAQLAYVSVKNSEAPAEIATTRLGHILQGKDAKVLFTAHPSLRDIEVQFVTDIQDGAFAAYATKGGYKRIELNAKKTPVDMIAPYILHEVQHAIQDIEGFVGGGNLSSLQSDENVTAKEAYDYYRKIAGEVEARNVSARINMTPEERLNTLLSETEDVAREDQIFLREGVEMAMAQPRFSLSEETTQIFDAAKAKFGTTYDMREAGYILPDGSMLDFSGRHQVRGGDTSFLNGDRTVDHREISDIAYDADGNGTGINTDLGDFLDRGAIRIDSNAGAINLNVAPTKAQKDRLKRLIERNDGYVYIDFGKGWDTEHYAEYEAARASRVLGDIDRYFDEGIKPTGNVRFSLQETNDRFNAELATLTEVNAREKILNIGTPSSILLACGIENKPIRLYGAKLLSKVRKHGYDLDDLKNLPLAMSEPIAVFNGSKPNSFAILTELRVGDNNILVALSVGKGGHDVDFNIISSVYDKRGDSVARWVNDGKILWVDKKKALDYFSVSAPLAEAQNNQELISTANIIQNFQNPKIEPRNSLITPEMDAAYMDAVNRGDVETAQRMVMEAAKLAMPNTKVVDEDGNPKVVYHGTPNEFTVFGEDISSKHPWTYEGTYYFTDNEANAKTYGGRSVGAFLNITNPYEYDFEGRAWKNLEIGIAVRYARDFSILASGFKTKEEAEAWRDNYIKENPDSPLVKDADHIIVDETAILGQAGPTADEQTQIAKEGGYDGNIQYNIVDVGDTEMYEEDGVFRERVDEEALKLRTNYIAFEPSQIKSADPVTYDDNGNIIPLSERFNPENKDIRYSLQSVEPFATYAKNMARALNIAQPIIVVDTTEEMVRLMRDAGSKNPERARAARGVYRPSDDAIFINAEKFEKREDMFECILHEWTHAYTQRNISKLEAILATLDEERVKAAGAELLPDFYKNESPLTILNEIISNFVGGTPKPLLLAIMRGQMDIAMFVSEAMSGIKGNEYADIFEAVMPVVKENITNQKERYNGKREEPIVIARWMVGDAAQENERPQPYPYRGRQRGGDEQAQYHTGNDRGGAREDAQEVTRFMLPDPDPSEVFYDEIPIFDEQGNEIDINTLNPEEAKAILDSKVRQMLEAEYEHNISGIRKEAREARQAIIDRYNEEKNKRKKNNKPSRTNAARIDDILGDKPFESLPLEDQALILIATGRAKIRWGDNGTQRGLASELGLTGSKGDKHAYRSIWSGATKSFSEVVHDWWESIGGQERGIDDQDLRNALIEAFQSIQSPKDAMGEIMGKYDDLSAERDAALAEVDRMEEKDLREAKAAYEQHYANFELSEGEERTSYHDRAAQFFANQNLSRTDEILEDLVSEMERQKRKIERLKAENTDVYAPLAEGIQKSKDIILHALERLRMFAGMETVDLNDVARLINLVKAARSQRQVENLSKQATALVQRVSIKKAKENLNRLLSLKLSNTDIIQQMLKTTNAWTDKERESVLKHLWKVSRNGLRVSKAVHPDTKNIFEVLDDLVKQYKKADDAKRKEIIEEMEDRLNPNAATIDMESKYQDYADTNKRVAYHLFKVYLEMLDSEIAYKAASSEVSKARESNAGKSAFAAVVEDKHVKGEEFLQKLLLFNQELENLIVKGKDDINAFYTNREEHAKEIRRMGIDAIGGQRARLLPDVNPKGKSKVAKALKRANAVKNATVNAPYWTLDTVLDKIDKAGKDGVFYKYFMDKFTDSNDAFIQRQRDHAMRLAGEMREFFPKIARFKSAYSLFTTIMHKADSTMLGEVRYLNDDRKIETIRPTISSAMYILAMWRQPRYKAGMEARGITQETIDSLYRQIKDVDEGYIKFMDWINDTFLPDTRLEYDVVHRALYGGSMAKEVNYFPANVLHYEEVKLDDNTGLGNISLSPSALKERTTSIAMPNLTMNYFKVLQAHLQNMDQWASFEELRIDLSTLLSSKEFKNRLMEMQPGMKADGSGAGGLFENLFTTSKIATGLYQTDYNTLLKAISYPQKKWVAANIAYRFWTGLKQLSSIPIFAFYQSTDPMSFAFFGKALVRGLNPFHAVNRAMNLSPSLRYRWESRFAGLDVLMRATSQEKGVAVYRGLGKKTLGVIEEFVDVVTRFGMGANAAMDVMACAVGVNMIYDYEIYKATKGKREATEAEKRDAIRKAEYAFNSTQQSSEGAYMSAMQMEPALSIYTAYKNASMAAHRKRSSGLEELWRLITSKEHREFLREELGEDGVSKRVDTAVSDIMQGFISDVGFTFMGTAGGMLMFSLLFGWDDDDWDEYWQSFVKDAALSMLNGYAFGGLAGEALGSGKVTFNPALDELRQSIASILDGKGDTKTEVADIFFQFGLGVDLKTFYNIAAGLENIFEEEDGNFSGAFLKVLNAPQGYLKAFVGDRREGESLMEYQTRIVRLNTIFDEVKYEDYFDEKGTYVGEGIPPIAMSLKQIQALRKEYEAAYRKDVLHHYGGKEVYASYMDTEKKYKDICELLGWKAETKPNKEKSKLSDLHRELAYEQKQVAKKADNRKNWVGSEKDYYDKLVDEQKAKDELINQYYEYIKQSGLGAY